jgi:hypothetical protein
MSSTSKRRILIAPLLFFIWLGLPQQAFSQGIERVGSADELGGNVYSLAIFISTPQNSWTHQDKLKIYSKQGEAEAWVIAQARRYGVRLAFQHGTYGLNNQDISVPNIPSYDRNSNDKYKYWVAYLLKLIGYKRPLDLWSWVQKNTNCTNLHITIYANSKGVSYATPFKEGIDENNFFIEGSIVYRYYPSGAELYAATIAHETMHLYGAWDLYNTSAQIHDVSAKSKQLFPNDVMYRVAYNIGEQQVYGLTAWRIGWNEKKEPWYDWFKPATPAAKYN